MRFYETTLEKLARILAGKYGIQVVFEGSGAFTDGKKITLPALPRDGVSAELGKDLQGYLDHETAHCIFSDFEALKGIKSKYHHFLANHCEDSRIEKLMIKRYPGCALHLIPLNEKWKRIAHGKWSQLDRLHRIALRIRDLVDGLDTVMLDPDTKTVFTPKVRQICFNLRTATSTLQVVRLTAKLLKEINQEIEQQPQTQPPQQQKKNQKQESQQEKEEEEEAKSEKTEAEDEESDETEKKSAGEEGESDGEEDQSASGDEDGSDGDDEEEGSSSMPSDKDVGSEMADFEQDAETATDVHSLINEELKEVVEQTSQKTDEAQRNYDFSTIPHVPVSTSLDEETEVNPSRYERFWSLMRSRTARLVGQLTIELERLLLSKENARVVLEQERGRLCRQQLAKLAVNPSYRTPFEKLTKTETRNTKVTLLCDVSGSMNSNNKIDVLKETVAIVAQSLERLQIEFEILSFTTTAGYLGEIKPGASRNFPLEHTVIKSFRNKNLAGICSMRATGCNSDGESLRWAARRLSQEDAARKIIMVFSDGYPNLNGVSWQNDILNNDLKKAVQEITAFGMEVVGVGICSDAVEHFYPDHVVVSKVEDLMQVVRGKLRQILAK